MIIINFFEKLKCKKAWKCIRKKGYISYYLNYSLSIFEFMIGKEIEMNLKNGKIGLFKIINAKDDVEGFGATNIALRLINLKDEKPIKEYTFEEFLKSGIIQNVSV